MIENDQRSRTIAVAPSVKGTIRCTSGRSDSGLKTPSRRTSVLATWTMLDPEIDLAHARVSTESTSRSTPQLSVFGVPLV